MKPPPFLRRIWLDGLLFICNRLVANIPSHAVRLAFYRGIMRFEIGRHSYVFCGAQFDTRGGFRLGNNSTINEKCRLDNRGGLSIGQNVSISADTCILTADHDPHDPAFGGRNRPVLIEDYAFIGTRALILPGVTLGRGAVVGAGAVVTRDVAPLSIVAGSPAREIGKRNVDLNYEIDYHRLFA
jgi:acetyltransferase-like isoleucine patch superfamily enzyme